MNDRETKPAPISTPEDIEEGPSPDSIEPDIPLTSGYVPPRRPSTTQEGSDGGDEGDGGNGSESGGDE